MPKRVLMCPPDHFDVVYAINPWMNPEAGLDKALAKKQYEDLKNLYSELGVEVWGLSPQEGLPDMVFSANPGHSDGNTFIVSRFRFEERRAEAKIAARFFEEKGFQIKHLPEDLFFEGQGDMIKAGSKYFLGYGKRTSRETAKILEEILDISILPLEMHDPYFYHLDTCLGPLSEEVAVINPQAFKLEDLEKLRKSFDKLIETNDQDNKAMACNLVVVGQYVILGKGISSELRASIEKEGFIVHETDMSEFLKAGGSVKCLTMELW